MRNYSVTARGMAGAPEEVSLVDQILSSIIKEMCGELDDILAGVYQVS